MRFLSIAPAIGISLLFASEASAFVPEAASEILQGGALAVLAWVVWYMLAKAFPAHNKALKDQREDFLTALKENGESLREDRKLFFDSVQKITQNGN